MHRPRPRLSTSIMITVAALVVAACGTAGGDPADTTAAAGISTTAEGAQTTTSTSATVGVDVFPVTIEHAFGATVVESEPARVVSVGFTDHDTLLALGIAPVAIRHWYGDFEYVWPWTEEALGDLEPAVLPSGELDFEQIAALEPDLIIGQYIGLQQEEYDLLSAIAPTVAQPADHPAFGAPWQLMARNIGMAVGRSDQAEALITEVEEMFAEIRSTHPEFEGVELAYAGVYGSESASFYVETDGSTRMRVLQDLGFVVPDELAALGSDTFYHDISLEQLELLEQQIVLWEPAVLELLPEVESNAIYQNLDVAKEERHIFMTDPLVAGAMAHSTPLSLPVVLDFLVPELERVMGILNG